LINVINYETRSSGAKVITQSMMAPELCAMLIPGKWPNKNIKTSPDCMNSEKNCLCSVSPLYFSYLKNEGFILLDVV
jgi:hypothetical protein